MTGGVIPAGADTVVMQERVQASAGEVRIPAGQQKGQNVRAAGCDIAQGQTVFKRGQVLRPAELGMIASLGMGEISVYRRLRVAFFSTGDELVQVGRPLAAGQIYDSNRYTIHGMLGRLGVESIDMGVIRDDPAAIEEAFAEAARAADVVISSGGVSVGDADHVKQMLSRLGEVLFWKIAMKPGRPLAYGRIGEAHFFGLPGNPVSAMVTFYQFVREALLVLMGVPEPAPLPVLKAVCTTPIKKAPGRTEFQRGILSLERNRAVDGASDRRPGLRHPVLHEPGQLLHHPARCPGQYSGRGDRGRAAAGRPHLIAPDVTGVVLAGGRGQRVGGSTRAGSSWAAAR